MADETEGKIKLTAQDQTGPGFKKAADNAKRYAQENTKAARATVKAFSEVDVAREQSARRWSKRNEEELKKAHANATKHVNITRQQYQAQNQIVSAGLQQMGRMIASGTLAQTRIIRMAAQQQTQAVVAGQQQQTQVIALAMRQQTQSITQAMQQQTAAIVQAHQVQRQTQTNTLRQTRTNLRQSGQLHRGWMNEVGISMSAGVVAYTQFQIVSNRLFREERANIEQSLRLWRTFGGGVAMSTQEARGMIERLHQELLVPREQIAFAIAELQKIGLPEAQMESFIRSMEDVSVMARSQGDHLQNLRATTGRLGDALRSTDGVVRFMQENLRNLQRETGMTIEQWREHAEAMLESGREAELASEMIGHLSRRIGRAGELYRKSLGNFPRLWMQATDAIVQFGRVHDTVFQGLTRDLSKYVYSAIQFDKQSGGLLSAVLGVGIYGAGAAAGGTLAGMATGVGLRRAFLTLGRGFGFIGIGITAAAEAYAFYNRNQEAVLQTTKRLQWEFMNWFNRVYESDTQIGRFVRVLNDLKDALVRTWEGFKAAHPAIAQWITDFIQTGDTYAAVSGAIVDVTTWMATQIRGIYGQMAADMEAFLARWKARWDIVRAYWNAANEAITYSDREQFLSTRTAQIATQRELNTLRAVPADQRTSADAVRITQLEAALQTHNAEIARLTANIQQQNMNRLFNERWAEADEQYRNLESYEFWNRDPWAPKPSPYAPVGPRPEWGDFAPKEKTELETLGTGRGLPDSGPHRGRMPYRGPVPNTIFMVPPSRAPVAPPRERGPYVPASRVIPPVSEFDTELGRATRSLAMFTNALNRGNAIVVPASFGGGGGGGWGGGGGGGGSGIINANYTTAAATAGSAARTGIPPSVTAAATAGTGAGAATGATRTMLDAIAQAEGTAGRGDYETVLGYGRYGSPSKPLQEMSLAEAYAFGRTVREEHIRQNNLPRSRGSSAIGRYQIVGSTMQEAATALGMDWNTTRFDAATQDRMAAWIAQRQGLGAWEGFKSHGDLRQTAQAAIGAGALAGGGTYAEQTAASIAQTIPPGGSRVRELQQGKIRDNPLNATTRAQLEYAAAQTGLMVEVTSGGQEYVPGSGRGTRHGPHGARATGSHRHDLGGAGDIQLRDPATGRILNMNNPEDQVRMARFMEESVRAGATGVGAGMGYMGAETMHIGGGSATTWGGAAWVRPAWERGRANPIDLQAWQRERKPIDIAAANTAARERDPLGVYSTAAMGSQPVQLGRGQVDVNLRLAAGLTAGTPTLRGADNFDVGASVDRTGRSFSRPGDPSFVGA